jgi:hypothetical protein
MKLSKKPFQTGCQSSIKIILFMFEEPRASFITKCALGSYYYSGISDEQPHPRRDISMINDKIIHE